MLQPARRKYRKEQKGRNTGIATRGSSVAFGDFGLKCTDRGRLTARQIEAARRAISRHFKRGGRIWIRVCLKSWHVKRFVWQPPNCRCAPPLWRG
jgi:large subunit ribosomal protein L16